jgi:ATP-dependent DNA helicase RecG
MPVTLDDLQRMMDSRWENERLEFKEAKQQYDSQKLLRYCVALANEGGGHLVLGVTDKPPRRVVGSKAFPNIGSLVSDVLNKLHIRLEATELDHPEGRVVVIGVPGRPAGHPMHLDGSYLMRAGEELVPMSQDQLRRIFEETKAPFLERPAIEGQSEADVVALLDVQAFFDLLKLPQPASREGVIEKLLSERVIARVGSGYCVSNLGAILLAKELQKFDGLSRKVPRVITYAGTDKLQPVRDQNGTKGYAVGFEGLISYVNSQIPANEVIGQALRVETKMYPEIAIRELVANALIHQDFNETGASVVIEIYADRMEISNPGKPLIPVERFVDEYKSRNERLADLMRRMAICEERSSGVDKVVSATEIFQLPAPDFRVSDLRTTAVLFAHQDFAAMSGRDRVRACYLHCCLRYVSNQRMTNQSLRERFKLPDSRAETVSRIIGDAMSDALVKFEDPSSRSRRYARYVPFWA